MPKIASLINNASIASLLYLALAPRLNKLLYRPMLFFPTRFPLDWQENPFVDTVRAEDVYFDGTMGQKLHGWYFQKPGATFTVLLSHGNSGNITIRDRICEIILGASCSVFVYDYQGFGRSSGKPSVEGVCNDAEAAYDCLTSELGIDAGQVILYGESLGAAVSTYLSSKRPCAGIILQSGFASLKRIAGEHFPLLNIYPGALFPKPPLDSVAVLKMPHPPLLLIHGEFDPVINVRHSRALYEAAVSEKTFLSLPNTSHADIWATAKSEVTAAIKEHVRKISAPRNVENG